MVMAASRGDGAAQMRREATDASTPIMETDSLAMELHEQVGVGEPVPEDLFREVARVLAGLYCAEEEEAP